MNTNPSTLGDLKNAKDFEPSQISTIKKRIQDESKNFMIHELLKSIDLKFFHIINTNHPFRDFKMNNVLTNKDQITLEEAIEVVTSIAQTILSEEDLDWFIYHYYETLIECQTNIHSIVSATFLDVRHLDYFPSWRDELIIKKNKFMPLIIAKMLRGDPLASNIYIEIYSILKEEELVSLNLYEEGSPFREAYISSEGSDPNTFPVLYAQHWLNSEEAKKVLCTEKDFPKLELLVGDCRQFIVEQFQETAAEKSYQKILKEGTTQDLLLDVSILKYSTEMESGREDLYTTGQAKQTCIAEYEKDPTKKKFDSTFLEEEDITEIIGSESGKETEL